MGKNCAIMDETMVRGLIRAVLAKSPTMRLMQRLDCVLLVVNGRGVAEVADWFGVGRRSIQRWVHAASAEGIDGLQKSSHGGRPDMVKGDLRHSITIDLQASPGDFGYSDLQWSGKRLALHLRSFYGISVSVRTCQRMIAHGRA